MVERRLRLRREAEVKRARARGRAWADGPLVARVLPNALDPPQNRYAVIAGKKVGKAHERNRAKRLVREAIRHLHPRLRPGHDVVVIVRGGPDELPGLAAAEASLGRIVTRAGLVRGGGTTEGMGGPGRSGGGTTERGRGEADAVRRAGETPTISPSGQATPEDPHG
jgi:ribonuclease P protein component